MPPMKILTILRVFASIVKGKWTLNGNRIDCTLGDVYHLYCRQHLPTLMESTRVKFVDRMTRSFSRFFNVPITHLDPEKVATMVRSLKESYIQKSHSKRYSFDKELNDLKSMLQWWADQHDFKLQNPVKPFHYALGILEEIPEKDRMISIEETVRFFQCFQKESLYQDLAITQFYCGGRIGEIAGIQIKNIDFDKRTLKIKEVISWIQGKPTLKSMPKNGKAREVFLNDTLMEIFSRRLLSVPKDGSFLFHDDGQPLRYNRINVAFNRAWSRAGFKEKFSGSHLLRYSSAQAARKLTGSLDAAASVTGHQSMKMAEHYGKLDKIALNRSCVTQMEKHIEQSAA